MGQASRQDRKPSFWETLPGLITAVGTFLGAVGGMMVGLDAVGVIGDHDLINSVPAPLPTSNAVALPAADLIYNQPVDEAMGRLQDAGLVVREADIGCSNSTDAGSVRQVTVGSEKNVHIIYGKYTDDIDEEAVERLMTGDEVTVWFPSMRPCPSA